MADRKRHSLQTAERIARAVSERGGRVYFVGGYVRDLLMERDNKDIDIEVHGLSARELREVLDGIGRRLEMGASFGVFGLKGCDLDIALPRRERSTGAGHKDFDTYVEPFIGTRGAAIRRDFTMNALMMDVLSGELVDHFGGLEDLRAGIVRHVNDESFCEDPLRVLRAAQFAARFDFSVAEETKALCATLDLRALSHERIMAELDKAITKAERPSRFFEVLRDMDQLDVWFPELKALIGVVQDPVYHAEGDAWMHTMRVIDCAAAYREKALKPQALMYAALVHDLGKAAVGTEDHARAGVPIASRLLGRLTNETDLLRYALNMVELHTEPIRCFARQADEAETNRMYDASVCPEDLVLLTLADDAGRETERPLAGMEVFLRERLACYRETMSLPFVRGADLIAAGLKPGTAFGGYLRYAHELRLERVPYEEALRRTLELAGRDGDRK